MHSKVSQPWYANDAGVGGTFQRILAHTEDIMVHPPLPRGYFLEPTNIILFVFDQNLEREEILFRGRGITIVTWSH